MFKSIAKLHSARDKPADTPDASLLIKEGYITKLSSKKRRYFVLYTENEHEFARLDYYESEKRFRTSPAAYKRSILLKDCFAVIKKYDPRFKQNEIFVFAIYTRDGCFSLMFDNQDEMNGWFSLINEVHLKSLAKNRCNAIHDYDKIWYTVIKKQGKKSKLKGSFYLCLTSKEIHLYKINNMRDHLKRLSSSSDASAKDAVDHANTSNSGNTPGCTNTNSITNGSNDLSAAKHTPVSKAELSAQENTLEFYRFLFGMIRKFGHGTDSLYIELGRSSDLGSCKLWFEMRDCDTPKHIHTVVANIMTTAKDEFRGRSNSENTRLFRTNEARTKLSTAKHPATEASSLSGSQSVSQSNTSSSINQLVNTTSASKSSCSLKFNPSAIHKLIGSSDGKQQKSNDKESSTEYVASTIAYTSVAYTLPGNHLPVRTKSTSESSSSQGALLAQSKGFASEARPSSISQSSNPKSSSTNILTTNESLANEDASDYYMTAPTQQNAQQPPQSACLDEKEGDYLMVDELTARSPHEAFSSSPPASVPFNKLDSIKKSDFKIVQTSSLAAAKPAASSAATSPNAAYEAMMVGMMLENANHHAYKHPPQYYSPGNSFIELPDPVPELNDAVDEYIQVELGGGGEKKPANRSAAISGEPSSEASGGGKEVATAGQSTVDENSEERDYIGIESFSSANQELTENFEVSNLSSTSCNVLGRMKTFSTSSNTSYNELNSLGTSPSLISSTAFYGQTPVSHAKEEVYKLEKVKSYFQTPEDDYIRPARAYSIGTRFERPKLANMTKIKHCPVMTKSKSNTINGPTVSSFTAAAANRKVQCGHVIGDQTCGHHCVDEFEFAKADSNRVRALSMGSHSTAANKRELLKKIRMGGDFRKQPDGGSSDLKKSTATNSTIEDEDTDTSEKCLSTPNIVENNYHRHRSSTFASYASTASTSSKTVNEESSNEEDDLMMVDLSKSASRFESEPYSYNHNQISIKEKFNQLNLDELK